MPFTTIWKSVLVRFLLSCWFSHLFIYKASPLPAYPCSSKKRTGSRKERGSTMLVRLTNDRGGFTQWFGSCSLMSTLYVWFPAWAPMVAERLFSWSPPPRGSTYPQHGRSASRLPRRTPERILGSNTVRALLVAVRQWKRLTALK